MLSSNEVISFITHSVNMHYIPNSVGASLARSLASGETGRDWGSIAEYLDEYPTAAEHALLNA